MNEEKCFKTAKEIYEDIKTLCEEIDSNQLTMEILSTEYDFLRAKNTRDVLKCANNILDFINLIPEECDPQIIREIEERISELDEEIIEEV